MKSEVTAYQKEIAIYTASTIGSNPQLRRFFNDDNTNFIPVLTVTDPFEKEVRFYCSAGLSAYPNVIQMKQGKVDIPIEILLAGYETFEKIPNILATSCFYIIENHWNCQPDIVFKKMIDIYYPDLKVKHILFTLPFLWQDTLMKPLNIDEKKINFLLGVPITDEELDYMDKNGSEELKKLLFTIEEIDVFDLNRDSVV